jgi:putative hemolysin
MDPPIDVPNWQIWTLVALFFGSFFFSGSETALTSLGEAKARQLRDRLGRRGRVLSLWIDHPKKVLTSLLIGNNLVNIGASALATNIALMLFGSAALAIVTGVMTLLVLIFGEITPKTLAREHHERLAVPILHILRPFYVLSFPLAWLLFRLTNLVSRLFGGGEKAPPVTSEDIDYLIDLGSKFGALEGVKRELLTSVLEFSDLRVKEIMIPRTQMLALDANDDPAKALAFITEAEHSRVPVYESSIDNIIGVLHLKDILGVLAKGEAVASDGLDTRRFARPAFFVPEVMKVSRLMKEMQRRRTHLAIVVDEFGGTSGLVTLEDVVEEIVGDIHDEHDVEERPIRMLPDGKILADAAVPLRDLEEILHVEFPDEGDYETLGGFLTATAGRVPPPGSLVAFGGYTFLIRAADEKRVSKVEIHRRDALRDEIGREENAREAGAEPAPADAGRAPGDGDDVPARKNGGRPADGEGARDGKGDEPRFFIGPASN